MLGSTTRLRTPFGLPSRRTWPRKLSRRASRALQEAIEAAERGNYAHVQHVLSVVTRPYEEGHDGYGEPAPERYAHLCVS